MCLPTSRVPTHRSQQSSSCTRLIAPFLRRNTYPLDTWLYSFVQWLLHLRICPRYRHQYSSSSASLVKFQNDLLGNCCTHCSRCRVFVVIGHPSRVCPLYLKVCECMTGVRVCVSWVGRRTLRRSSNAINMYVWEPNSRGQSTQIPCVMLEVLHFPFAQSEQCRVLES